MHYCIVKSNCCIFNSPGQSPGRAIVLPGASVLAGGGVSKKFNIKVFYVMGKALSGELSCPCDRSCYDSYSNYYFRRPNF